MVIPIKIKNTVVIVENKPDILNIAMKFLKLGDFDTISCSNAEEALKVIEERHNDIALILLDSMISGLNKEKFLLSIKSDERYKHILVNFFTHKGLKDNRDGNFPFPYIFKPPRPPGDLTLMGQGKPKEFIKKQVLNYESYCKFCGAILPKGQSICHKCGNKIK